MNKKQIVLADDHKIVRDGLKALLDEESDMAVVAEAEDGKGVLEIVKSQSVDIIIMDISMPSMNGIECTRAVKEYNSSIKVLALTMMEEEQHVRNMIRAGASGYIMKESGQDELVQAIREVLRGNHYFSDSATQTIMMDLLQEESGSKVKKVPLTSREIEILRLISMEYINQEIAKELNISIRTVDAHRRNLLQKIGARNTAGLVKYAIDHEILY